MFACYHAISLTSICLVQACLASFQEKCVAAGMDYDEVVTQAVVWQGAVPAAGDTASAAPATQDAEEKPSAGKFTHPFRFVPRSTTFPDSAGFVGDAQEPLPEGWSEAKDQQQRTYYWHTKTKKVQWERPTAATPA